MNVFVNIRSHIGHGHRKFIDYQLP